jgi:hypothetical protein
MSLGRLPSAGLATCLVGVLLCPLVFIAGGALSGFSAAFSLLLLPPSLLGCGFLLRRYLAKPGAPVAREALLWSLEAISWLLVVAFLYFLSGVNLLRGGERFGAVCTAFLAASSAALPFLLLRPTRLETRMARLPRGVSVVALLLILGVSILAMSLYLTSASAFIGELRGVFSTPADVRPTAVDSQRWHC